MNINKWGLALCALLLSLVGNIAKAATACSANNPLKHVVMFENGVRTSIMGAIQDSRHLIRSFDPNLSSAQQAVTRYGLAYNHTHRTMSDLWETITAKAKQDNLDVSFWAWVNDASEMPDWAKEIAQQQITNFNPATFVSDSDVVQHMATYRSYIAQGMNVLVFAHSEGNLLVNAEYNLLYFGSDPLPSHSFGFVSAATPASTVAGNEAYTTITEDQVIRLTAEFTPPGVAAPLSPNVTDLGTVAVSLFEYWWHDFGDIYLYPGSNSANKIISDGLAEFNRLVQPSQVSDQGAMTISLMWGAQPDLDLHVTDPDGAHVYYLNPQGSGTLSKDDTDGYGPEEYSVLCGGLQTGTYHIAGNYFGGTGTSEQAIVEVDTPAGIRLFPVILDGPNGTGGNDNPTPIADVEVAGDPVQGYTFAFADKRPANLIPNGDLVLEQDSNIWDVVKTISAGTTPRTFTFATDFGAVPPGTTRLYFSIDCLSPGDVAFNGIVLGGCGPDAPKTFESLGNGIVTAFTLRATQGQTVSATVKIDWEQ